MSREITNDFKVLKEFLSEYQLNSLLAKNDFTNTVSQQHKKYFAFLTYIAELQSLIENTEFNSTINTIQFSFIKESCSDCGMAFFNLFHGSYKASKLLLRSSIETFLKGFCLGEIPDLNQETSIYRMFERVKSLSFFHLEHNKTLLDKIHSQYKMLCMDVHTASDLNMANLSALNYFPEFRKSEAQEVVKFAVTLIPCYMSLLAIKYNHHFHSMHYKNKQIIIINIESYLRPLINNVI